MSKLIFKFFFILILFLFCRDSNLFAETVTVKSHIPPPTNEEVLSEIEKFTGLGSEIAGLMEKESALLESINKQIYYIKIIENIYAAKDWNAIMVMVDEVVNDKIDKLMEKLLPKTLNTYITIAKAAKTSMEIFRDHALVPYLDHSVYEVYKSKRSNSSAYNPREAFDETLSHYGPANYFALKERKTQDLIKSMGYNPALVSDEMYNKIIMPKLETFWFNQLETLFQQEEFEKEYPEIERLSNEKLKNLMDKVKSLSVKPKDMKWEMLLIKQSDLPKNAFFVPKTYTGDDGAQHPFDLNENGPDGLNVYLQDLKGWKLVNIEPTHINLFYQQFAFSNVQTELLKNPKSWPSEWTQIDVFCSIQMVEDYKKWSQIVEKPSSIVIGNSKFNSLESFGWPFQMDNNIIYKGYAIGVIAVAWNRKTNEYSEPVSKRAEEMIIKIIYNKINMLND